jgi:hypothetical protein
VLRRSVSYGIRNLRSRLELDFEPVYNAASARSSYRVPAVWMINLLTQWKPYVPKLGDYSKKKKGRVIWANQVGLSRRGPVWRPLSRRHLGTYKNSRVGRRFTIIRILQSFIEALLYESTRKREREHYERLSEGGQRAFRESGALGAGGRDALGWRGKRRLAYGWHCVSKRLSMLK